MTTTARSTIAGSTSYGDQRGFTLIEIMVVIFVLSLFAALIAPNVIKMKSAQELRNAYPSLQNFCTEARQDAIRDGIAYAVTYDGGTSGFVMRKDQQSIVNVAGAASGTLAPPAPRPLVNAQSPTDLQQVKTLSMPSGIQASLFRVGSNSTDGGSWMIHFYPDGTSDGGGVEFTQGTVVRSVYIDSSGIAKVLTDHLPDPSTFKWEAGTYEQKI